MTKKIDNKAKNSKAVRNKEKVEAKANAQQLEDGIELTEKKIQEMEDNYELVTGYKIDYNDIDWNKFVYGYSLTKRKTTKILLYSLILFSGILWAVHLIYPHVHIKSIIYPYFFQSVLLYLVSMQCFIPFIVGHLPIYDSISISAMLEKIRDKTSKREKSWFFGRWLLIMIVLGVCKAFFELAGSL